MKRVPNYIAVRNVLYFLNAEKVKVGYADYFGHFETLFEGEAGDLMFRNKEAGKIWAKIENKRVTKISAESGVLVVGVDQFDAD